jgi:hypothetical protein
MFAWLQPYKEVVWENVRVLGNGETVSTAGTHLGHNLQAGAYTRPVLSST